MDSWSLNDSNAIHTSDKKKTARKSGFHTLICMKHKRYTDRQAGEQYDPFDES